MTSNTAVAYVPLRKDLCDAARQRFADSTLSYSDLNLARLEKLRSLIDIELVQAKLMNDTLRPRRKMRLDFMANGIHGEIRCKSSSFATAKEAREAIAFNPCGFIGFAGWADDKNIQPFVKAFHVWMDWLLAEKEALNPKIVLDLPWHAGKTTLSVRKSA